MILNKGLEKQLPASNLSSISVIIPVYRNASNLLELHEELKKALNEVGKPYEILFVNDDSPDDSGAILAELSTRDPHIKVVTHDQNRGQNRAILTGLKECSGERAVILDADLQDPPHLIPILLAKLESGFDTVFAGRRGRYESLFRIVTSKLFKMCLSQLCQLPRDAGLFMAINRPVIDRIQTIPMERPFLVAMIGLMGCKTCSIPFIREKRKGSKTSYTFFMRLQLALSTLSFVICNRKRFKKRSSC